MKRRETKRGGSSTNSVTRAASRPLLLLPFRKGERRGEGFHPGQPVILVSNRQQNQAINLRLLRQVCAALFEELLEVNKVELGITLVAAPEMRRLNETFLQHEGSTDVITFDYTELGTRNLELGTDLHGELFVCVDEAVVQARRFRTTWQSEIVRYIVHGVLHLLGHDDRRVVDRRKMKRQENRLLRLVAARFPLSRLGHKPRLRA